MRKPKKEVRNTSLPCSSLQVSTEVAPAAVAGYTTASLRKKVNKRIMPPLTLARAGKDKRNAKRGKQPFEWSSPFLECVREQRRRDKQLTENKKVRGRLCIGGWGWSVTRGIEWMRMLGVTKGTPCKCRQNGNYEAVVYSRVWATFQFV